MLGSDGRLIEPAVGGSRLLVFDLPVERVKMASTDDAQSDGDAAGGLWPPADYQAQVERLRAAIGERIYLAELRETDVQLGVQLTDRAYELLDVIDFPRPDPARGLTPHLILLDDGRGLNLGRIA
ncbi:MAG: hypothetical protein ACLFS2_11600, partial [Halochromatium sp.]